MTAPTGMAGIVRPGTRTPSTAVAQRPSAPADTDDLVTSAPTELPATPGQVPRTLPAGTVLLRVIRQRDDLGHECFRLELQTDREFASTGAAQDLRSQRRPEIRLSVAAARNEWTQILRSINTWSANKATLHDWLGALRKKHGTGLRLIVWDETGFEIPWELFVLRDAEHRWLAAGVELIRWTSANAGTGAGSVCHGPVLSFVDPSVGTVAEYFADWPYRQLDTMQQLIRSLTDDKHEVGLVHVWAHGKVGANGAEATLGGMTMDDLLWDPMIALAGRRTLVLLNACGSAQLMDDDRFNEQATRSFAQVFLESGAPGVVATVGEVGRDYSINLLNFLLRRTAHGQRSVSQALLDYRARLAGQLQRTPTDEMAQKFVNGFMYQYLGSFDTTLHLTTKGDAG
ncbi:CHAT domain-containing protein [Actinoplanes sp. G11-F43]|uniref:CHAT domain-containing protein n=1 Tax=Actinoplanes sp. G11-F43 TaxID=3424130 RepID=UPI003D32D7F4